MLSPILLPIFSEVVFTLLDAVLLAMFPVCDAQTTIFIGEKKKQQARRDLERKRQQNIASSQQIHSKYTQHTTTRQHIFFTIYYIIHEFIHAAAQYISLRCFKMRNIHHAIGKRCEKECLCVYLFFMNIFLTVNSSRHPIQPVSYQHPNPDIMRFVHFTAAQVIQNQITA